MTEKMSTHTDFQPAKLSVYIITFNEADKIAAAVQSVTWADEVLVLDSNSSDDTAKIATELGATIKQIPFTTFGKLRNDAIAACKHDWVFSLDADERCTPAAQAEIMRVLSQPDADAYYVPRRNWFMGRWIRHSGWYPDYRQPQLFRKSSMVFDDRDEVHESYRVEGKIGYFEVGPKMAGTITMRLDVVVWSSFAIYQPSHGIILVQVLRVGGQELDRLWPKGRDGFR